MKYLLSIFLGLFIVTISFSQTKEGALRDARITAKATMDSDFKTVLKYTLPSIVEMMGGEENALNTIKMTFDSMKSEGVVIENSNVISVSDIVKEQDQYRCYVQNNLQMIAGNYRVNSESYLLGIYNEKEKIWHFIEAKQLSSPFMEQILPDFKTELKIPEKKVSTEKIE